MNNDHHVYFAVFGFDCDHLAVTLAAGIEPDDIWRKGESFTEVLPEAVRRENRWILSSQLDQHASHRDHFEKLLLKLERLGPALDTLRAEYRCGIGVSRYFFMDDPGFYLPEDIIARYQALGFDISFDQLGLDNR
ncbi:MAG: DUF4279 domain-containing protein [Alcanivoracaceae bacterium]|nr:DUF4279 domain-containing protein [Alcanivoracaceae bacterium]